MDSEIAIETQGLIKKFILGNRTVQALKGINIQIKSGEFIILFGPSGSGKTTLLNMIAGLDKVTSGSVIVQGVDIAQANEGILAKHRLEKIGMVFQDFNLIEAMTALDNVALPLVFGNVGIKERLQRAKRLLEDMGLGKRIHHRPVELSGGEQQRVAIARALINDPWIFLVDEPTGNLDSKAANDIMKIIVDLNRRSKRTVVLVTHNPNYLGLADRVLCMQDGQIINEMKG